jgi:hypothetical protein
MIASRRIFIVSSSHPYHNCKIPFLYEHVMTPSMTPRRRRYLFLLSISSRSSTSHIVFAPIMFALHSHSVSRSSSASVTIARPRSSLLGNPSINQKFYIIQLLSDTPLHSGSFRLYIMYHQNCRFCLICTNTSYVTPDFHTIRRLDLFSYSS